MPEREPMPVAGLASAAVEISDAKPEAVRESRPPLPYAAEALGEIPGEIADLATPRISSVEPSAEAEAAGSAERELSSTNATERTPEGALSLAAVPAVPEHPVEPLSERPSNPRRGWWQRLIQP
jgi:hypothetical protein